MFSVQRSTVLLCLVSFAVLAQVPDSPAPAPAAAPAPAPAPAAAPKSPGSSFLGKDVPFFNPGSEVLQMDGKAWNVNNNRLFEARFEKYLNAPEATTAEDRQYQAVIAEILNRLAPGQATTQNIDYAFRLLPHGSNYEGDARLCASLADAVYTVWLAQRQQGRLTAANEALRFSRHSAYFKLGTSDTGSATEKASTTSSSQKSGDTSSTVSSTVKSAARQGRAAIEVAELEASIKSNDARKALSEIQAKVEFQALIVQFFMQRRFQHVLMATRFYRSVFSDGDSKLNLGKDAAELFQKTSGVPPTISVLDSLANEGIRDVREGVKSFTYLIENNELESGTKRLAEAFTTGEFMPEIRTLPREKKRQALGFAQKSNELVSAMEGRDFGTAERLLGEIKKIARDFNEVRLTSLITPAKQASNLHLAAARNAALKGDQTTLEKELREAGEMWPTNPALSEVSKAIFTQGDVQQQALIDLDRLISQKNFRQISENSSRFIAAAAMYPERQDQLKKVLTDMQGVEGAIMRAEEMRRQSNFAGAWESVESAADGFPDDSKLNQVRADLTTQAADFVRTLRGAQDLEKKEQVGSSLAWFLKAQKLYPGSRFADEGIERLKKRVLPQQ